MTDNVGKTIANLRKEKGWTQTEFAQRIGVTGKAVSKWETGHGLPDTTLFPKIADIFGVSVDCLMKNHVERDKNQNDTLAVHPNSISIEEQELIIAKMLHNGIIKITELLETKDIQIIKKGLFEYPVHPFELDYAQLTKLYDALEHKRWRELFEYSVDHENQSMAIAVINEDSDATKKYIDEIGETFREKWNTRPDSYSSRSKIGSYGLSDINSNKLKDNRDYPRFYDLKGILEHLQSRKQQILDEAVLKWDKEQKIGHLTKDYFVGELEKGNLEMVIIKLCVRLEAIFKCDYHYEGDLSDMLNQFCSEYGHYEEDDGWGYSDWRERDFVKPLHKLRRQRNSIVHSEKAGEEMTQDEINFCINYICGMG